MSESLTTWTQTTADAVRWWLAPDCRDRLLGPNGLRLAEWLESGQARLVKRGPHRLVYRLELPGLVAYSKKNCIPDIKTWLRQVIRPSKARMEFNCVRAVAARGIATVEPLALGEQQALLGAGESYLVTRSLENTEPLNAFMVLTLAPMPAARHAQVRKNLAVALGRFVARLHDAGIRYDDLHAANILVRLDADDQPELFLIDLNALHVGEALDWTASRENLIILSRWFVPRSSRTDRLRFWRAYHEARGWPWPTGPAAHRDHFERAREIEHFSWVSSRGFWKKRDARCLKSNRYFRRVRGPG